MLRLACLVACLSTACASAPDARPDGVRAGSIVSLAGAASGLTGVALVATSEDRDAQLAGAAIGAVGALALVTGGLLIGAASVPEDEPGVTITPLGVSGRF